VGGQPALAAPDGEDHWLVPLQSRWLVQRLEVLFVGQGVAPGTAASLEFAVPALGEIPVRQSIWAVSAPGGYRLRASEPSASFTPLEHALAGLRNLTAIAQGVAELPDVEGEPLTRWYGDFSGRWLAVRGSVARALAWSEAAPEVESVRAEVESLEKRQAAAADRLGLASLASQAAGSNPPTELATTWLSLQESRRVPFQYGTAAAAGPIRVVCQEESTSGAAPRVLAALAVAVLACAAASHARRGTFSTLLVRWPYVAGFIAGAAWWWWLRPSVLGLCLALACAAAGAWSFWRQRSARRLA
jgi:hypothetical protein